jgi:hypothetical protein
MGDGVYHAESQILANRLTQMGVFERDVRLPGMLA